MTDPENFAPWFTTTPEAILRAESILVAFHENRAAHIGEILAEDYANDAPPGGPIAVLVALIGMADRLADYGEQIAEPTHRELIRDAARVVAEATYNSMEDNTDD